MLVKRSGIEILPHQKKTCCMLAWRTDPGCKYEGTLGSMWRCRTILQDWRTKLGLKYGLFLNQGCRIIQLQSFFHGFWTRQHRRTELCIIPGNCTYIARLMYKHYIVNCVLKMYTLLNKLFDLIIFISAAKNIRNFNATVPLMLKSIRKKETHLPQLHLWTNAT